MSEVKHTPGPWKLFNLTDVFPDDDDLSGSRQIADCNMSDEIPVAELAANARLIVAAPDMLEAATPFAEYGKILLGQKVRDDAVMVELFGLKITVGDFRKLASVIAKAEGKA